MAKIVPFQNWRPLTPEERSRVPSAFHWLRVSRVRRKPPAHTETEPSNQPSDGVKPQQLHEAAARRGQETTERVAAKQRAVEQAAPGTSSLPPQDAPHRPAPIEAGLVAKLLHFQTRAAKSWAKFCMSKVGFDPEGAERRGRELLERVRAKTGAVITGSGTLATSDVPPAPEDAALELERQQLALAEKIAQRMRDDGILPAEDPLSAPQTVGPVEANIQPPLSKGWTHRPGEGDDLS